MASKSNSQEAVGSDPSVIRELFEILSVHSNISIVRYSCKHYGINSEGDDHIARARLALYLCGIHKPYVRQNQLDMCIHALSQLTQPDMSLDLFNQRGIERYPLGWIPCLERHEALRQFIVRLLDQLKIAIPQDTSHTVFCGIEPPTTPSFELKGCFEHFFSSPSEERHERWVYIDKALSVYGVYPGQALYRRCGRVLADAMLPARQNESHGYEWQKIRLICTLGATGVGPRLELDKTEDGEDTQTGTLLPWGMKLKPPYAVDYLVGFWISVSRLPHNYWST